MKNQRRTSRRAAAAVLVTAMTGCLLAPPVYAGPPTVDTDESLYVNLDYYGMKTEVNVVKGCSLNGTRSFSDYGTYEKVINMSNEAQPQMTEDGIIWQLPEDSKERFYYECQLDKEAVVLPWDFDVSYRLNGVPAEAQKLLHADGLVEIEIHCIPNNQARDYYKNNMLLQVAMILDMEDINSVRAEGSQLQEIGTYKAVIFAAVPGQEKTFRIEIGTSDFTTSGVIMMMIPGTLDQLKEVKDIKDMKDTLYDSTDELTDSLNQLIAQLSDSTVGMDSAKSGLQDLQKARESLDRAKDSITANLDQSLADADALNARLTAIEPDININKQAIDEINESVNEMVKVLRKAGDDTFELAGRLGELEEDLDDVQGRISSSDVDDMRDLLKEIDSILNNMDSMAGSVLNTRVKIGSPSSAEVNIGDVPTGEFDPEEMAENIESLIDLLQAFSDPALSGMKTSDKVDALIAQLENMSPEEFVENYSQLVGYTKKIQGVTKQTRKVISNIRGALNSDLTDDLFDHSQGLAFQLANLSGDVSDTIWKVNELNQTLNDNKEGLDQLMDDTAATAGLLSQGSTSLTASLHSIHDTMKNIRGPLESGTRQTLDGLIRVFDDLGDKGTLDRIHAANDSMRNSVKEELDKIEEDTNFLNLDAEADLISFTSDRNKTPSSIQVIMRTEEITDDDVNTNAVDIEPKAEDVGVWQRVVNLFKRIWEKVSGIFE